MRTGTRWGLKLGVCVLVLGPALTRKVVFGCRPDSACENKSQDTFSLSVYYKFF